MSRIVFFLETIDRFPQSNFHLQKTSITKKMPSQTDKDLPHNMSKKDLIRSTDFNFLMVLGKGSFGKVKFFNSITEPINILVT